MSSKSLRVDFTGTVKTDDCLPDENKISSNSLTVHFTGIVRTDDYDEEKDVESGMPKPKNEAKVQGEAKVNVVKDLNIFEGAVLEEKIDSLIDAYPVVMFNRTWCLFSVDAQDFLVRQVGVPVHSVEVDKHPQGKDILKYVYDKTNHKTTPVIFMKGKFLGGFDEVNTLYTKEYLQGLSQADRCQAFMEKSKLKATPYFWFPEKVNGNVVRITGILSCFVSALTAALVHSEPFFFFRYIAYALAIDYFLRLIGGARFSPLSWIGLLISMPFDPNPRLGRPKQFATFLGTTLAILASVFYAVDFPYSDIVGSVLLGCLAVATFMEGFLDYCVGCTIFRWGVNLGLLAS
jgi:glutaredoxin